MMGTTTDHQLAIDIGNTSVKAGVFLNGKLTGSVIRFTDQEWDVAAALELGHASAAASVRGLGTTDTVASWRDCLELASVWGWRDSH